VLFQNNPKLSDNFQPLGGPFAIIMTYNALSRQREALSVEQSEKQFRWRREADEEKPFGSVEAKKQ
jgi:hypothetical protein